MKKKKQFVEAATGEFVEKKTFEQLKSFLIDLVKIEKNKDGKISLIIDNSVESVTRDDFYKKFCDEMNRKAEFCKNQFVWLIYGMGERKDCLQVASSYSILKEIKQDIKAMLYAPTYEIENMNTFFYENVYTTFQCRYSNPIYYYMFNSYNNIEIYILNVEEYLDDNEELICKNEFSKSTGDLQRIKATYAEVKFAYESKAIYWNPFGIEKKMLKCIQDNCEKNQREDGPHNEN
mgnify:FL=1